MAGGGSTRVIWIALFANGGIAIAKFIVAGITRSSAMMAEAIHSVADTGNQALLLVGAKRSKKEPDQNHPLGYGREAYFWALLVAFMLFSLGAAYSLYEGIHKVLHPEPVKKPMWALGVLFFGIIVEGYSLRAAWKEAESRRAGQRLFPWARTTGNVNLLVVLFEDIAACAGLVIAFIAIGLTAITGNPIWDALGTCVIGLLLLYIAIFLVVQVRRLIVGFTAGPDIRTGMVAIWNKHGFDVLQLAALWVGPDQMIVVGKVTPRDTSLPSGRLVERLDEADREVYKKYPEVRFHFVEPDFDADGF